MITGSTLDARTPPYQLFEAAAGPEHVALAAAGELDLAARDELAALLDAHLCLGRRFVRLDLGAVTFLDCSCLNVLLGTHHRLVAAWGMLALENVVPPASDVLRLTGLDEHLITFAPTPGSVDLTSASASLRTTWERFTAL